MRIILLSFEHFAVIEERLVHIGFTKNEARLYVEMLRVGPQPVSVIANRCNLNRTTAYSSLKALNRKGVISTYMKNGAKYFAANDPNSLIGLVDRQQRVFDYHRNELLALIPKFRELQLKFDFKKPVVGYFEGMEGVKHVMYDALSAEDGMYRSYMPVDKWLSNGYQQFLLRYKDFRIDNKQVQVKALAPDTEEVRAFFDKYYDFEDELTEIMYASDADLQGIFDSEMNIYDDKVALVHFDKAQEYGVLIESKEIASMQRSIFDMLWQMIKNKSDA